MCVMQVSYLSPRDRLHSKYTPYSIRGCLAVHAGRFYVMSVYVDVFAILSVIFMLVYVVYA